MTGTPAPLSGLNGAGSAFHRRVEAFWLRAQALCHRLNTLEDALLRCVSRHTAGLAILGWLAVLLCLAYVFHEPWRDETQSWLMARDMSLLELIHNAGWEGHPIGWHVFIKPLVLSGLPFWSLRVLCLGLTLAAAALIVFRGPFRLWQALVLITIPPFIEFGTYARCYSLLALLLCLTPLTFQTRMRAPFRHALVLGGLANTLVLCVPFAALMGAGWLWEAWRERVPRRVWLALILLALLGCFAVWQILPPPEKTVFMLEQQYQLAWNDLLGKNALFILSYLVLPPLFVLPMFVHLCRRSLPAAALLALSALPFLLVHCFVWSMNTRHVFTLYLMLLAVVWILRLSPVADPVQKKHAERFWIWFLLLAMVSWRESQVLLSMEVTRLNTNTPFAVAFARNYLRGRPLVGHFTFEVSPLSAHIPGLRFWNPAVRRWETFTVFDMHHLQRGKITVDRSVNIIFRDCPIARPTLVFSERWDIPQARNYALVFVADRKNRYKENYFIYMPAESIPPELPMLPPDTTCQKGKKTPASPARPPAGLTPRPALQKEQAHAVRF